MKISKNVTSLRNLKISDGIDVSFGKDLFDVISGQIRSRGVESGVDNLESNKILRKLKTNIFRFITTGTYDDILSKREERKDMFDEIENNQCMVLDYEHKDMPTRIGDRKGLVDCVSQIFFDKKFYPHFDLSRFFGIPEMSIEDFDPSDTYYYKGISQHILVLRQLVCEGFHRYDEYTDHFSPNLDTARAYANGSRRYRQYGEDGNILCINKEKLNIHLQTLRESGEYRNESCFEIHVDSHDKRDLSLYHTIVPISCVDLIVKVPPKR